METRMSTTTLNTLHWTDRKKPLWALGLFVPSLPFIFWALAAWTGMGGVWWLGPVILYLAVPILDALIGEDRNNPPESAVETLEAQRFYRWVVYLYIPMQYAATVLGAWLAVTAGYAAWELLGLVLTIGIVNGIGINTAHELGHKKEALERQLAKLTLAPVAYGHFFVEHNRGHHVRAATPDDPASSRMGETFWAFLPRTVIGSLRSAWELEAGRLRREGHSPLHWSNQNLQAWGLTVLLFGALTLWLGWSALIFLIAQAAFGISLLEVVNYLEHYGLLRQKLADGRYERVQPTHSWNSNNTITNLLLYQLQRHSDHHANPTRRYQSLRHFDESPQLPSGYATLIPIAYIPALWFRLMDRRVVEHYRGDLTRANLHPSKREALLSRWQPDALAAR
jgi:alkane 1-monooxygenase